METVKTTTKIEGKDMFRFQLYHTYFSATGVLLGLLSVLALADLIGNFAEMTMGTRVFCIILIVWALVLNPVSLYFKSKRQVESTELFKNEMNLEIKAEGLELSQGEKGGLIEWKDVTKVVILKKIVIFYMGKVRAHLLPLDQLSAEEADAAVEAVKRYAAGVKVVNKRKQRRK